MRDIIMAEVEESHAPDLESFSNKKEFEEDKITKAIQDMMEDEDDQEDLDNNMYLLGILDQDLINGWEAWMAVLTSKEYLADLSFEESMKRCIQNWEADGLHPLSFPAIDGNVTSKPPMRRAGLSRKKCLLLSRKQWKSLAHFMNSFQSHVFGGAEAFLKKLFHNNNNSKNQGSAWTSLSHDYCHSDANSSVFKKWISVKEAREQENKPNKCFGGPKAGGFSTVGKMRIEIRTDDNAPRAMEDEECLNLMQNQWIRIKVTMFSSSLNFYQMEIDLVQSFVCATNTDRCRRRIAKVVKREVTPKIDWEKGVNAAGSYFAVHWNRFQIPELSSIEQDKHDKFELCNFEYELRLRFFSDDEFGQTVASACSFPLAIMTGPEEEIGDGAFSNANTEE